MNKEAIIKSCSFFLGVVVIALALVVWASERLGSGSLTVYKLFPLLGLVAFSLMWTHYVLGSLRRFYGVESSVLKQYYRTTSWFVLALILLHPGLLIYQLKVDGFGLPPQSYLTVYGEPGMKFAIMLGTISLLIFLAFELKKKFEKKTWWRFVEYAQIFAMGLIFYHGLTLGRELSVSWYRAAWFFYGLSLILAVVYNHWYDSKVIKRGIHGTK
jgi:hypothetical protein